MKINNVFTFLLFFILIFFFNIVLVEANEGEAWVYKGDPSKATEASQKNNILIVNKNNPLPKNYVPATSIMNNRPTYDKAPEANNALIKMVNDAKKAGYSIQSFSGYRDYDRQNELYNQYVTKNGQAEADKFSSRPGYSEHQTGMAFDIKDSKAPSGCEFSNCGNTSAMKWLSNNAHKYGFILRYTSSNSDWTGFQSEFWHYRYIGEENSEKYKSGGFSSLEQFLGLSKGQSLLSLGNGIGIVDDIENKIDDIKNGVSPTIPNLNVCAPKDGEDKGESKNGNCKEYDPTDYTKYTDKKIDVSDLGNVGVNTKKNYDNNFQEYKLNGFMKFILSSFHTLSLAIAIIVFGYVCLVWLLILMARTHMAPIEDLLRKITMGSVDPHENLGKVIKVTIIILFFVVIAVSGLMPLVFSFIYEMIIKVLDYIKFS